MKICKNDFWIIYYDNGLDSRVIVKEFRSPTSNEARRYFSEYARTSNDETSDFWKLCRRSVEWWRVYYVEKGKTVTCSVYSAKGRKAAYSKYLSISSGLREDIGKKRFYYSSAFSVGTVNDDGTHEMRHMVIPGFRQNDGRGKTGKTDYETGVADTEKKYREDVTNFIWTGHSKYEWYDIGNHIIEDLRFNIPILIKKMHGFPNRFSKMSADRLGLELNGNGDLVTNDGDKIRKHSELSVRLWKDELKEFLKHLNLYVYYSDYGIIDGKDKMLVEIDEKYRKRIPYFKGTFDIDYKTLGKMTMTEYRFVMKWLSDHMLELWD